MAEKHSIISRSFSQQDMKRLGCGALFIFLIMEVILCIFFRLPIFTVFGSVNLDQSLASLSSGLKMLRSFERMGKTPQICSFQPDVTNTIYNLSNIRSDVYEINGDIRINSTSATIFAASNSRVGNMSSSWFIRPYPRKHDNTKFEPIRDWTIHVPTRLHEFPGCDREINVPAILFSAGAFSPNYFHSFTDILIPLYLTSRQFNRNVIFLITHYRTWWETKYKPILEKLSKYDIIDIDNSREILCFSRMIVGLRNNREFGLDPMIPPHYSMKEFRQLLRNAYSLKRESVKHCRNNTQPRMLIVSREKTRRLINENQIVEMARKLGYYVDVKETGWNLRLVAKYVNSVDVLIGVHGAGLTNMVFLPENAIVIQIVPFGLDVVSREFFEYPSQGMNFTYLPYHISLNESTLLGKYPVDSQVYREPNAIHNKAWKLARDIYFDGQDFNIDLDRFRNTLLKASEICS